ncbi:MAG TPA: GNAT family N-acetyltransferase [Spirochaetota bacterium]|nr:GNAT family N-acetyltransferase [Spirochaetota bacterium]HQE58843.1 GNAT family N-acetyltransferase [Spirochaetota bacterium]
MNYVSDYIADENLFSSFNDLANKTFSLDFSTWKKAGCYDGSYVPHSFAQDGKIIANVSVTKVDMMINHKFVRAIQIGTVVTDASFRGQGLSRKLIEVVLKEYSSADLFYLFANDSVLDFYPKFGFHPSDEFLYCNDNLLEFKNISGARSLNRRKSEDIDILKDILSKRVFLSQIFGIKGAVSIPLWHFLNTFTDAFHYIPDVNCVAVYSVQNGELCLYDVISESALKADDVLPYIISSDVKKIIYHFMPDEFDPYAVRSDRFCYDKMFYLGKNIKLPDNIKYPAVYTA